MGAETEGIILRSGFQGMGDVSSSADKALTLVLSGERGQRRHHASMAAEGPNLGDQTASGVDVVVGADDPDPEWDLPPLAGGVTCS